MSLPSVLAAAALIAGCGSSSHSAASSSATSNATATATASSARAPSLKQTLVGTKGGAKASVAVVDRMTRLRRSGLHAHLTGLSGLSLPQKLEALAANVAAVWTGEFQLLHAQLAPATVNIIDQTPATCGSSQTATMDPPTYCPSDASIDLPVAFIQTNVEPIGDAAVALVVADLYGYHVLNAIGQLGSTSGLSPVQIEERDSCLGGVYFVELQAEGQQLTPADQASVSKELVAISVPGTGASANAATADELTAAFNKGLLGRGDPRPCLK